MNVSCMQNSFFIIIKGAPPPLCTVGDKRLCAVCSPRETSVLFSILLHTRYIEESKLKLSILIQQRKIPEKKLKQERTIPRAFSKKKRC